MTEKHANYLLALDKYILVDGLQQEELHLTIDGPVRLRWKLVSPEDLDQEFLVDIKESEKKALALSLHHQDDISKSGVMRIDYFGRHKNPDHISETVPPVFHPYAGIYLDNFDGHIHYVIDKYPPLAWAIPLDVDSFQTKTISSAIDITDAISNFCQRINIKTKLNFNIQLRII